MKYGEKDLLVLVRESKINKKPLQKIPSRIVSNFSMLCLLIYCCLIQNIQAALFSQDTDEEIPLVRVKRVHSDIFVEDLATRVFYEISNSEENPYTTTVSMTDKFSSSFNFAVNQINNADQAYNDDNWQIPIEKDGKKQQNDDHSKQDSERPKISAQLEAIKPGEKRIVAFEVIPDQAGTDFRLEAPKYTLNYVASEDAVANLVINDSDMMFEGEEQDLILIKNTQPMTDSEDENESNNITNEDNSSLPGEGIKIPEENVELEGEYKVAAIRIMTEFEYRMVVKSQKDVWQVFFALTSLSVCFPLLMWGWYRMQTRSAAKKQTKDK